MSHLQRRRNARIGRWISRLLLAVWFVGMIGMAVWNGQQVEGQGGGNTLYLPITHHTYDLALRDYVGLGHGGKGYFTIRADGSEWQSLVDGDVEYPEWSPDGRHFAYTAEGGVWVVPLESRQPHFVASGEARFPVWSPDSRYFVYPTTQAVQVFDVQTFELRSVPIEGEASYFYWSPDGDHLAWTGSTNGNTALWLWSQGDNAPRLVSQNRYDYGYGLSWSPDGNTLIYNHRLTVSQRRVYTIVAEGSTPTLLFEDASMWGWVEGGARILLWQNDNLYLAQPDGSDLTLLQERVYAWNNIAISPKGDQVYFSSISGGNFIQSTSGSPATLVEFGDECVLESWQRDGPLMACVRRYASGWHFLGSKIANSTAAPLIPLQEFPQFIFPRFVSGGVPYLALSRYATGSSTHGGYPILTDFEGSYLVNLQTGVLKRTVYPNQDGWDIGTWRYMP